MNPKNSKKFDKCAYIILVIFATALILRLFGANNTMYNDEGTRAISVRDSGLMGNLVGRGIANPPLYNWIAMTFTSVFGMSNVGFRLVHIIFGIAIIYLAFLIAKRYFGSKAAVWTVAIMGFSYYHILSSTLITIDGSILAFLYLLTLYFFMRYREFDAKDNLSLSIGKKKFKVNKWLLLTSVAFGFTTLTKSSAILVLPPIVIYSLMKSRNIRKTAVELIVICLIGALMFSSYLILSIFDPSGLEFVKERIIDAAGGSFVSLSMLAIQFAQAAIFIGPFLIGMLLLAYLTLFKKDERDKNTYLLLIFIATIIFFYAIILQDNFRPIERYFMALTAPISILAGAYLSKIKFEKKHFFIFISVFVIFSGFLFYLNLKQNEYLPFYPKEDFIRHALSFDWSIYLPFLGNEGPLGFYLSLDSVAYSFIFAFIAFLAYIVLKYAKDAKFKKYLVSTLVVFMAVSFSFNVLITEEYLFTKLNPDIEKVSAEMIKYANSDDVNLKKPLFFFRNFALEFYTTPKYGACPYPLKFWNECSIDFPKLDDQKKIDLVSKGGTVLVVDFPKTNRESLLWKKLNKDCKEIKSFYDQDQEIGFIFEC